MNAIALSACMSIAAACAAFAQASVASEPEYGVCRKQVVQYVEETLGQTVTRVDIKAYADRSNRQGQDVGNALAFVEECSGFHSFQLNGTWSECEHIPHYGSGWSYIFYQGPFGACKAD